MTADNEVQPAGRWRTFGLCLRVREPREEYHDRAYSADARDPVPSITGKPEQSRTTGCLPDRSGRHLASPAARDKAELHRRGDASAHPGDRRPRMRRHAGWIGWSCAGDALARSDVWPRRRSREIVEAVALPAGNEGWCARCSPGDDRDDLFAG